MKPLPTRLAQSRLHSALAGTGAYGERRSNRVTAVVLDFINQVRSKREDEERAAMRLTRKFTFCNR